MAKELHLVPWARAVCILRLRVLLGARLTLSWSWDSAETVSLDPDLTMDPHRQILAIPRALRKLAHSHFRPFRGRVGVE